MFPKKRNNFLILFILSLSLLRAEDSVAVLKSRLILSDSLENRDISAYLRITDALSNKLYNNIKQDILAFSENFSDSPLFSYVSHVPELLLYYQQGQEKFIVAKHTSAAWLYIYENIKENTNRKILAEFCENAIRQNGKEYSLFVLADYLISYYNENSNLSPLNLSVKNNKNFLFNYAWLLYKRGNYLSAEKLFNKLRKVNYNADIYYYLGMCSYFKGEKEKAYLGLKKFLKLRPAFSKNKNDIRYWSHYYFIKTLESKKLYQQAYNHAKKICDRHSIGFFWTKLLQLSKIISKSKYANIEKKYLIRFPKSYKAYTIYKDKGYSALKKSNVSLGLKYLSKAFIYRNNDFRFIKKLYGKFESEDMFILNGDFYYDYFFNSNRGPFENAELLRYRSAEHNSNLLLLIKSGKKDFTYVTNLIKPFYFGCEDEKINFVAHKSSFFSNYFYNRKAYQTNIYFKRLNVLLALGFSVPAEREIKTKFKDDTFLRFSFLTYLYKNENNYYKYILQFVNKINGSKYKELIPHSFYRGAYPLFLKETVLFFSKDRGVPPLLSYSVMRTESHFKNIARSTVGATGLMQLMPATGKWLYDKLKFSKDFSFDLNDSELNLQLGIIYLGDLLSYFDNQIYAIAAYNGGMGNVNKWIKKDNETLLHFSLTVPYDETEKYIQKVIRSYMIYRTLYPTLATVELF